jgi:hypothetical protein
LSRPPNMLVWIVVSGASTTNRMAASEAISRMR